MHSEWRHENKMNQEIQKDFLEKWRFRKMGLRGPTSFTGVYLQVVVRGTCFVDRT